MTERDRLAMLLHEQYVECLRPLALSRQVCLPTKRAGSFHLVLADGLLAVGVRVDPPFEVRTEYRSLRGDEA